MAEEASAVIFYIMIPKEEIVAKQEVNQLTGEVRVDGVKPYSYFDMLDEFVWNRNEWRKDEVYAKAWSRLLDAHEEAQQKKLPYVACLQEDYALFKPFATMQDRQIGGPNAKKITRMSHAVVFASTKKPELALPAAESNGVANVSEAPAAPVAAAEPAVA